MSSFLLARARRGSVVARSQGLPRPDSQSRSRVVRSLVCLPSDRVSLALANLPDGIKMQGTTMTHPGAGREDRLEGTQSFSHGGWGVRMVV